MKIFSKKIILGPLATRLEEFMKHKKIDPQSLARLLGYDKPEKIYRLFREGDNKPGPEIIQDISNKFEDLNIRWWLTGKGNMLVDSPDIIRVEKNERNETQELVELRAIVEVLVDYVLKLKVHLHHGELNDYVDEYGEDLTLQLRKSKTRPLP